MDTTPHSHITQQIEATGVVAILRASTDTGLIEAARAMSSGGVDVMEVPLTTPNALQVIRQIADELGDRVLIGVGSVIDTDAVKRSADAGARFIVTPTFKPDVIQASHDLGLPCLPGALTPTEIQSAWEAGGDIIKVFPAPRIGGPSYIRDVLAPLPHLKLMPTGGVTLKTIAEHFAAGAVCLGVGTSLLKMDLVQAADWPTLTQHARAFMTEVASAKP